MTVITSPEEDVIKDYQAEIAKQKKRLDAVYGDIESLRKDKVTIENDISNLNKQLSYLSGLSENKTKEIGLKMETIKGLDSQITDKESRRDSLEKDINRLELSLSEVKKELEETTQEIKKQQEDIRLLKEEAVKEHKLALEKHAKVEAKLQKLFEVGRELNG